MLVKRLHNMLQIFPSLLAYPLPVWLHKSADSISLPILSEHEHVTCLVNNHYQVWHQQKFDKRLHFSHRRKPKSTSCKHMLSPILHLLTAGSGY